MTKTLEKGLSISNAQLKMLHTCMQCKRDGNKVFEVKISISLTFFFSVCKMQMAKSIQSLFFPQKLLQKKKEAHMGVGSEEK
jgi:hypothetical protein